MVERKTISLIGKHSPSRSVSADNQRLVNMFANVEDLGSKSKLSLHPTPGYTEQFTAGIGPNRGDIVRWKNDMYVVSGKDVIKVSSTWTTTVIGQVKTLLSRISARDGRTGIVWVDGDDGYAYDGTTFSNFDDVKATGLNLGTATFTNGSATVTGTNFLTQIRQGDKVYLDADGIGSEGEVSYVNNNTTLTLTGNYTGAGGTGASHVRYAINDFPKGAKHVSTLNGRWVSERPESATDNGDSFNWTDPDNPFRWPAFNVSAAVASSDKLLRPFRFMGDLQLIGERSTERHYVTTEADLPFRKYPGGVLDWGTIAPNSVVATEQKVFFLSNNESGSGQVKLFKDNQVDTISTPAIDWQIKTLPRIDDAEAYTFQEYGHLFYVLTFPTALLTIVYDDETKRWFKWESLGEGRHVSSGYVNFNDKHIVGDFKSNKYYALDSGTFTDNGTRIVREFSMQVLHKDDLQINFWSLILDVSVGKGLATGTGSDPQVLLEVYNDGGLDHITTIPRSLGKIGEHNVRVVWRKLGKSRTRTFSFIMHDPVEFIIKNVYVDYSFGAN